MNGYLLCKTATIAGCCLTVSWVFISTASAVPFSGALPANATRVSDIALSHVVGRGVIGGKIVYFGVEMQTNWTSGNQQTPMRSTMNIALNSQGNIFLPTITYSVQGALPQQANSAKNQVSGEGLQNIQGVTQAIQIGGNSNAVQNGMSLNVVQGTPVANSEAGKTSLSAGIHTVNGVTMTVQPGQLSMALNNSANSIQQGIGPNGVYQISQVRSDMNNIQNHMTLTLGVNSSRANTQNLAQLQSIASGLRDLQPAP